VRKYIKIQGEKIVLIANNSKLAHSMPFHYLCADTQGMLGVNVFSFLYIGVEQQTARIIPSRLLSIS
jgi:hypothetical protein